MFSRSPRIRPRRDIRSGRLARYATTVALLATVIVLCSACTRFEHPIVDEHGPSLDEQLVGHWRAANDERSADLVISRDGQQGHVRTTTVEKNQPPETEEFRLITATIERQTFGSVSGGEDMAESWAFFRYEFAGADRLIVYPDNQDFWTDAVRNNLISGNLDESARIRSATVTASSAELRAFVQGYGSVIFRNEALAEFTRVPAN